VEIARLTPARVRCYRSASVLVSINALIDMNLQDYPINYMQRQLSRLPLGQKSVHFFFATD
jgi:hypothetical protein